MKIGDKLRNNMYPSAELLPVIQIFPNGAVLARDPIYGTRLIDADEVYTDNTPRKTGYTLIPGGE